MIKTILLKPPSDGLFFSQPMLDFVFGLLESALLNAINEDLGAPLDVSFITLDDLAEIFELAAFVLNAEGFDGALDRYCSEVCSQFLVRVWILTSFVGYSKDSFNDTKWVSFLLILAKRVDLKDFSTEEYLDASDTNFNSVNQLVIFSNPSIYASTGFSRMKSLLLTFYKDAHLYFPTLEEKMTQLQFSEYISASPLRTIISIALYHIICLKMQFQIYLNVFSLFTSSYSLILGGVVTLYSSFMPLSHTSIAPAKSFSSGSASSQTRHSSSMMGSIFNENIFLHHLYLLLILLTKVCISVG